MIEFQSVTKRYPDGTVAVDGLSLVAESGKITVLVGPSGCGKTTSLRMVNRMIDPTDGTIIVNGTRRHADRPGQAAPRHRLRDPAGGAVPAPHGAGQRRPPCRCCSAGPSGRRGSGRAELMELVGLAPGARRSATRRSCPVASSSGSGWPARSPPTRRCCSWTSRSARSTRWCGTSLQDELLRLQDELRQDDHLRHPRHRRGDQARRQGGGAAGRRAAGPVRRAGPPAVAPGRRLRRLLRRPRPRLPRARLRVRGRAADR